MSMETIKESGNAVADRLVTLCNVCYLNSMVPEDWMRACIVPNYKGKDGSLYARTVRASV